MQHVTCTFTNAHVPQLTVTKVVVGGAPGDVFDLEVDGGVWVNNAGDGGTSGKHNTSVGLHTVGETLGDGGAVTSDKWEVAVSGDCAADGTITLALGDDRTCTITNTRKTFAVSVTKVFVGTPTSTELFIGTSTQSFTANGQQPLVVNVPTGTSVNVGETVPANYTAEMSCTGDNGFTPYTGSRAVSSAKTCTIRNTRATGTIEVKKVWVGTPGSATLKVGTEAGLGDIDSGVVNGQTVTIGATTVDTGTYYVSEVLSQADAGLYTGTVACVKVEGQLDDEDHPNDPDTSDVGDPLEPGDLEDSDAPGEVPVPVVGGAVLVDDGDHIVCTFTNTRGTGTIEVKKVWVGTPGSATLKVGTEAGLGDIDSGVVNGQTVTIGATTVDTGTYYVSEVLSQADAGLYTGTVACVKVEGQLDDEDHPNDPDTSDVGDPLEPGDLEDSDAPGEVPVPVVGGAVLVDDGDHIVCTFTNTRGTGTIEVKKVWVGTAGTATLQVGTEAEGDDVASQVVNAQTLTTGAKTVGIGTYYVSEVLSQADAGLYTGTVACVKVEGQLDDEDHPNDPDTSDVGDPLEPGDLEDSDAPGEVPVPVVGGAVLVDDGDHIVCTFTNTRKESSITVAKVVTTTNNPGVPGELATLPEPGGNFTYGLTITNTSAADSMTITSIVDNPYGDLLDAANPNITSTTCKKPMILAPGATAECAFTATLLGTPGAFVLDEVTVTATDESARSRTAKDTAKVQIDDVPSAIRIVKTANPTSLPETGGEVTFTVAISNPLTFQSGENTVTSVDTITIDSLVDDRFGDLASVCLTVNIPHVTVIGVELDPGESVVCTFTKTLSGLAATPHRDIVTVTGHDDDDRFDEGENRIPDEGDVHEASDDAIVTFTNTPPASPTIDLSTVKTAPAALQIPNGSTTVTFAYTIQFANAGPNEAHAVVGTDTAPTGVTFLSITQQPTNRTCTLAGNTLTCPLGSLLAGESVVVVLSAQATVGTFVNSATVTGAEFDPNLANNTASATTVVTQPAPLTPPVAGSPGITVVKPSTATAPLTPPVAKPTVKKPTVKKPPVAKPKPAAKPKAAPVACSRISVAQKTLEGSGDPQTIIASVKQGTKGVNGARIVLTGPGIRVVGTTGPGGNARITIKPKSPGIVKLEIGNKKACNSTRVGIVAAFEPPVTG